MKWNLDGWNWKTSNQEKYKKKNKKMRTKLDIKIKYQEMKLRSKWIKFDIIKRMRNKIDKINKWQYFFEFLQGKNVFQG
jgi:hypothetical protein